MQEMQEMWVQFLGQEDPLEKEMATHTSVLAWKIPWTEEPGGLVYGGRKTVRHDRACRPRLGMNPSMNLENNMHGPWGFRKPLNLKDLIQSCKITEKQH